MKRPFVNLVLIQYHSVGVGRLVSKRLDDHHLSFVGQFGSMGGSKLENTCKALLGIDPKAAAMSYQVSQNCKNLSQP